MEFLLLLHQGPVGRSEGSQILWEVITRLAPVRDYMNLSRKLTTMVNRARKAIDKPPDNHPDLKGWTREKALKARYPEFLVTAVPPNPVIKTGPGGGPLRPPTCWVVPRTSPNSTPRPSGSAAGGPPGAASSSAAGAPPAAPQEVPRYSPIKWR